MTNFLNKRTKIFNFLNEYFRQDASKIFAGDMENDDMEIDIDKILADAEEKSKLAAIEFEKAGDSIAKKFSLDENHSYNIYDYQGLCFAGFMKTL